MPGRVSQNNRVNDLSDTLVQFSCWGTQGVTHWEFRDLHPGKDVHDSFSCGFSDLAGGRQSPMGPTGDSTEDYRDTWIFLMSLQPGMD